MVYISKDIIYDNTHKIKFAQWFKEKKYVDLCLTVDSDIMYCHKFIVCENSVMIDMLYRNSLVQCDDVRFVWPTSNTLDISLPNTIPFNAFKNAIEFMYKENINPDVKISDLINAMIFLLMRENLILDLINLHIASVDPTKLNVDHINCLCKYIETFGTDSKSELNTKGLAMVGYYGKTLASHIVESPLDELDLFDHQPKLDRSLEDLYWASYNTNSIKRKSHLDFFGIDWILETFEYNDRYIIDFYVREDCMQNIPFNIRIQFTDYTYCRINKKIIVIANFLPSIYKKSYRLLDDNSKMVDWYNQPQIKFYIDEEDYCYPRFSLLIEKISDEEAMAYIKQPY